MSLIRPLFVLMLGRASTFTLIVSVAASVSLLTPHIGLAMPQATTTQQEGSAKKGSGNTGSQTKTEQGSEKKTEQAGSAKKADPFVVKLAKENIEFTASGTWKSVPRKSRIIAAEVKVPSVKKGEKDGRLTFSIIGGTITANVDRWKTQFVQPDGTSTNDKTKIKKETIAGKTVHMVDITGTYLDSAGGGPFSGKPKVKRENYRLLGAIVETGAYGNCFLKFYGPKATVDKNAEHFKAMVKSIKIKE